MRLEPTNIQQIGDELAVAWNDGTESYFELEMLRRGCPWAACVGEPGGLGNILRPRVNYTETSFQLIDFDLVGGYALQPRWADGHGSGIYSFTYLRRLEEAARGKISDQEINGLESKDHDRFFLFCIVRSRHFRCLNHVREKGAAKNERDSSEKSRSCPARLDSGLIRNRNSQQRCCFCDRLEFPILQPSWN